MWLVYISAVRSIDYVHIHQTLSRLSIKHSPTWHDEVTAAVMSHNVMFDFTDWEVPSWRLRPLLTGFLWESNRPTNRYGHLLSLLLILLQCCDPLHPTCPSSRSFRRPWWVDGEAVLSQMLWRIHSQVFAAPPHRWGLLWNRFSPHAVHGAPGTPPIKTNQSVCPKV